VAQILPPNRAAADDVASDESAATDSDSDAE